LNIAYRAGSAIRSFFTGLRSDKAIVAKVVDLLSQRYSPYDIFGRNIYDIPEIRTAINFVGQKVSLVPFTHIVIDSDGSVSEVKDSFNRVLTVRANPYQSPSKYKQCIVKRLMIANNAYIMPEWDDSGNLVALWPLPFAHAEYTTANGIQMITFQAPDGPYTFPYADIIHLTRFPDLKEGARNDAPREYLEVTKSLQKQAVKDAENSGRINAMMTSAMPLKDELMKEKLEKFKKMYMTAENTTGIGMIDAQFKLEPLNLNKNVLKLDVMQEITNQLYNYFGVSNKLVGYTATELENEQFVDGTAKPIVYGMNEEYTFKLFSNDEIDKGNRITGDTLQLEISTLTAKTSFINMMLYHGPMNGNEARRYVGMNRGPKELDEYRPNLNGVNAKGIDKYQNVEDKTEGGDKQNEE